jgi:hypothetical protein
MDPDPAIVWVAAEQWSTTEEEFPMHSRRDLIKRSAATLGGVIGLWTFDQLAASAAPTSLAQGTPQSGTGSLSITITATEFAFDAPAQVPAGLVTVTMNNAGAAVHMAQIGRLNDDVTFDQFKTVLETKPQGAALPLFQFRGGPNNVAPGGTQEVINTLDAGHYVLICFVIDPDGVPHFMKGMLAQFEVVGNAAAESEPASDLTVSMMDFAYTIPAQITPGRHVWKVVNSGPAPHEMEIVRLAPGVTQEQAVSALMARAMQASPGASPVAAGSEAPPFMASGGMGTLAPGATGWLVTDLPAGDYVAYCQVPDPATHKLHFMEGMLAGFTVSG